MNVEPNVPRKGRERSGRVAGCATVPSLRALLRLHLHAFARGPMPTLFLVGLVFGVVFSPHGLDPHLVPHMLAAGTPARAASVGFAFVLSRAASRAMLFPPGGAFLRASPLPRWVQLAAAAVTVLLVQSPWLLVFAAGGAPLEGLGLAVALSAACLAPSLVELAVACALALFAAPLSLLVFLPILVRAYRTAPVWGASSTRFRLRVEVPFALQLVTAQLRSLVRGGITRVALSLGAPLVGLFLVSVAAPSERAERTVSLAALVAALGAAPLLAPLSRVTRAIAPWVRASARGRRGPLLVALAILATPSISFAAGASTLAPPVTIAPFATAVALASVLLVSHAHLSARRRDAALLSALLTLPLIAVFTILARSVAFAALALVVSLGWPQPEVTRADDR